MHFKATKSKYFILTISILAMAFILCGCASTDSVENADNTSQNTTSTETTAPTNENNEADMDNSNNTNEDTSQTKATTDPSKDTIALDKQPMVTLNIKDMGSIKIALLPDIAPNTVNNFIHLTQDGFYNGLIFHRVIKDFMIQGGDPTGTGMGGPNYSISGEFTSNNFSNPLSHTAGVISMARSNHPDSAGSQFFIVHKDSQFLDGQYAAFGVVIEGMDVVDAIAKVATNSSDRPEKDVVIESATIELNEYTPQEVQKIIK